MPPTLIYPAKDLEDLAGTNLLNQEGRLPIPNHVCLLRGPAGRIVLIDLGGGTGYPLPPELDVRVGEEGMLPDALRKQGVSPEDVTDVIFTHLHADHVGWAVNAQGTPSFAHARHYVHALEWRHWVERGSDEWVRERMLRLGELVELWEGERLALAPWLTLFHTPGHTPGSCVAVAESGDLTAAFVGDLYHHPVEIERPELTNNSDLDHAAAVEQRSVWAQRLTERHATVFGTHFPGLAAVQL
ncbi:MBL fold metallo-hydrolase [Streptomyces sp. NPDC057137]|uniref:MBL fold metallo-hydrolase n=1 Tax=Streptomyces sp. NPDC057137 TaxID=3346030 RepID=UPI0036421213